MGRDLEILKYMSDDDHIRHLVDTLLIQDDCDKIDPYAATELPSAAIDYNIWPRDAAGWVVTSEFGIADLAQMLNRRRLCPRVINISDHRPMRHNFNYLSFFPELTHLRGSIRDCSITSTETPRSEASIARDLIEGADVAITSVTIKHIEQEHASATTAFDEFTNSRWSPAIKEAVFQLTYGVKAQSTDFSLLHSAHLCLEQGAKSYWLEKVFYEAKGLNDLTLVVYGQWNPSILASRVIPRLSEFTLRGATISAEQLLALLVVSKETLTHICFRAVELHERSTWHEVLSFIANEYSALTSFTLIGLREEVNSHSSIDFHKLDQTNIPEECRPGLRMEVRRPEKRTVRVFYNGPSAGMLLTILSRHGYAPSKKEIDERRVQVGCAPRP